MQIIMIQQICTGRRTHIPFPLVALPIACSRDPIKKARDMRTFEYLRIPKMFGPPRYLISPVFLIPTPGMFSTHPRFTDRHLKLSNINKFGYTCIYTELKLQARTRVSVARVPSSLRRYQQSQKPRR